MTVRGGLFEYGPTYGLSTCAPHDVGLPPYCVSGADSPAFCSSNWCYVNSTTCESASPSSYIDGAFYSYAACDGSDVYASFLNSFGGTIQLCSVFSAKAAQLVESGSDAGLSDGTLHGFRLNVFHFMGRA